MAAGGQRQNVPPLAVIDIGSNAVRLIFYDVSGKTPEKTSAERVMAGLGKGLKASGHLNPDGIAPALTALEIFRKKIAGVGAAPVVAVATAAVRDAKDGPDFLEKASAAAGQNIRVLSGEDEARLTAEGVLAGGLGRTAVIGDLGGGSLELVATEDGAVSAHCSLPLGTRRIEDAGEPAAYVADTLESARDFLDRHQGRTFVALGGAWRALGETYMARDPAAPQDALHGYALDVKTAQAFAARLFSEPPETLEALMQGRNRGSQGLAEAGLLMAELLKRLGTRDVIFSETGLREGLVHTTLKTGGPPRSPKTGFGLL